MKATLFHCSSRDFLYRSRWIARSNVVSGQLGTVADLAIRSERVCRHLLVDAPDEFLKGQVRLVHGRG